MARGVFVHGMDREAKAYCLAGSFLGSGEFCLTSATFGGSDDELLFWSAGGAAFG